MKNHQYYMRLALDLSEKGRGNVSPNPMVGCVIVKDGIIIGTGFHEKYGTPHAEPNAVASVKDKTTIKGSDIYVSLEPCAHYGKTPPCADLLVSLEPKRVFIAIVDKNPLVGGKGIEKLKKAGIEVITGLLEKNAFKINVRFFTFIEQKRPYILLKWAETKDGFIAGENYKQKKISNDFAHKISHQMRADEDAILVGFNTALHDNPSLTPRLVKGNSPLRLFIDKRLEIPQTHNLLSGSTPTICYNLVKSETTNNVEYVKLQDLDFTHQILKDLYNRKITSLIVEGGKSLLQSFIDQNLWDKAKVFVSESKLDKGISAPKIKESPYHTLKMEDNRLNIYKK